MVRKQFVEVKLSFWALSVRVPQSTKHSLIINFNSCLFFKRITCSRPTVPRLGPKSLVTHSDSAMRSAHVAETPPPLLKSKIVSISIMQGAHYNSHTHAHTYTHTDTHMSACWCWHFGQAFHQSASTANASKQEKLAKQADRTVPGHGGDADAGRHCQTFH